MYKNFILLQVKFPYLRSFNTGRNTTKTTESQWNSAALRQDLQPSEFGDLQNKRQIVVLPKFFSFCCLAECRQTKYLLVKIFYSLACGEIDQCCRVQLPDPDRYTGRSQQAWILSSHWSIHQTLCSYLFVLWIPEVAADGCSSLLQLVVAANACSWLLQLMVADICRTAGCSSSGISSEKDVYKCRRLLGAIMKLNEQEDLLLQLSHLDPGYPLHIRGSRLALILLVQVKFSPRVQISKLCKNEQI